MWETRIQSSFTVTLHEFYSKFSTVTIDELYSINRLSANLKVSPVVLRLFMSFTQLSEFPTLLAIPKVGPVLLPFQHRVIKILKGTWALVLSVQGSNNN